MKTVCTKDNCTGCMACVESCPKNAIKIVDELDSYNAIINEEQCVNCDLFSMCACGKGKRRHRDLLKPQSQGQLA